MPRHGQTCGNGEFTHRCQNYFEQKLGSLKCLMTTSCTDALEMCALLADIGPGDEVIVPSYTFVSSALAFSRQGATVVFADSCDDNPDIDPARIEALVTPRTRAIVPVHYAGIACDMDAILDIARRHNLLVIEDAAQGIDSFYKGRPLGSIGDLAAFSFHETKNVQCGEGGLLAINNPEFVRRAEILWERAPTAPNSSAAKSTNMAGSTPAHLSSPPNMSALSSGPRSNRSTKSSRPARATGRDITTP